MLVMDLKETEARNDCAGETGCNLTNQPTNQPKKTSLERVCRQTDQSRSEAVVRQLALVEACEGEESPLCSNAELVVRQSPSIKGLLRSNRGLSRNNRGQVRDWPGTNGS
jgi:hypothetical protein